MQTDTTNNHMSDRTSVDSRIVSLDVLRGFDMLWLVGGAGVALGIGRMLGSPYKEGILRQFEHAKWEGFYFYDLIFPLFVFLAGIQRILLGRLVRYGRGRPSKACQARNIMFRNLYSGLTDPAGSTPYGRTATVRQLLCGKLFCFLDWKEQVHCSSFARLLGTVEFVPFRT